MLVVGVAVEEGGFTDGENEVEIGDVGSSACWLPTCDPGGCSPDETKADANAEADADGKVPGMTLATPRLLGEVIACP